MSDVLRNAGELAGGALLAVAYYYGRAELLYRRTRRDARKAGLPWN